MKAPGRTLPPMTPTLRFLPAPQRSRRVAGAAAPVRGLDPLVDPERAAIAHVLRRCTFGPHPWQVEDLVAEGLDAAAVIERVLAAPPLYPAAPGLGGDDEWEQMRFWWPRVMADRAGGIHEKLVWFWHGHLTSAMSKAGKPSFLWTQHLVLREHAMGDFRALLQAMTVDAAMLIWLDGTGSQASAPNQNHARELMELFALGHGEYTQADVEAAAVAMAGWWVDWNTEEVAYDEWNGPTTPVWFLDREVSSVAEVVDAVCDHPACAPFVAGRLHRYLLGFDPDESRRAELGEVFASSGLQIRSLVEAIVRHPSFLEARAARPRFPVEWMVAASGVLGTELNAWMLDLMDQAPFDPPNVAGWPVSPKWLTVGNALVRAQAARDYSWETVNEDPSVAESADPVDTVCRKAGLYELSPTTLAALRRAADRIDDPWTRATVLQQLVVACPEFALA